MRVLPVGDVVTVRVVHPGSGACAEFPGRPDLPLLDQMEEHCPFPVPSLCWAGACGRCAVAVRRGADLVEPDAFGIGASEESGGGEVLVCVAGVREGAAPPGSARLLVLELARPAVSPPGRRARGGP